MPVLVLAYGNTDRQDDGVAWHVLRELAVRWGGELPATPQEGSELSLDDIELRYMLQLTPEIADDFAGFGRVIFIDAHTGAHAEDIHLEAVAAQYQASPLTHHLTPASCLAIAQALHGSAPEAILVSIRGYQFGFETHLSPPTAALVPEATQAILDWLK